MNIENTPLGITQKTMSTLSGISLSTINRIILKRGMQPLNFKGRYRYTIDDAREILKYCVANKYRVGKKVQSFYNFKGGVGKTSICFQVAAHIAFLGFKVLVIDADPQGHLTLALRIKNAANVCTLYDAILGIKSIREIIVPVFSGLDCIPSNLSLTRAEMALNEMPKREEQVIGLIEEIKDDYDFIFFDTNPTISYLNRNIITSSEMLNIVVETQAFSLYGINMLLSDIRKFTTHMRMKTPEMVMLPNKYEYKAATSIEAMDFLLKNYSQYLPHEVMIRKSEDFNIASKSSLPLALFCKEKSIALQDITSIINFILQKSCIKE